MEGHSSVLGGTSESVVVGRESLTDVGGVSWLQAEVGGEGSLSDRSGEAPEVGWCWNSQGDTRQRSTLWGTSEGSPATPQMFSPEPQRPFGVGPSGRTVLARSKAPAEGTGSEETEREQSTSVEWGEPTSAGMDVMVGEESLAGLRRLEHLS